MPNYRVERACPSLMRPLFRPKSNLSAASIASRNYAEELADERAANCVRGLQYMTFAVAGGGRGPQKADERNKIS